MYKLYQIQIPNHKGKGNYSLIQPFLSQKEAEDFAYEDANKLWCKNLVPHEDYPRELMMVYEVQFEDFIIEVYDKKQRERDIKLNGLI